MSAAEPPLPPTDPDLATVVALGERFAAAWRQGPRPRLEDFLPADAAGRRAALTELVKIDLFQRLAAGDRAALDDYLAPGRFPELADDPARLAGLRQAETIYRARLASLHGSTVSTDTPPLERPPL